MQKAKAELEVRVQERTMELERGPKGAGIGLFMSRNIIESMNGSLTVRNTADGIHDSPSGCDRSPNGQTVFQDLQP